MPEHDESTIDNAAALLSHLVDLENRLRDLPRQSEEVTDLDIWKQTETLLTDYIVTTVQLVQVQPLALFAAAPRRTVGPVLDLEKFSEGTRQTIYAAVVATHWNAPPAHPDDFVPQYTPDEAGLQVVPLWPVVGGVAPVGGARGHPDGSALADPGRRSGSGSSLRRLFHGAVTMPRIPVPLSWKRRSFAVLEPLSMTNRLTALAVSGLVAGPFAIYPSPHGSCGPHTLIHLPSQARITDHRMQSICRSAAEEFAALDLNWWTCIPEEVIGPDLQELRNIHARLKPTSWIARDRERWGQ